MTLLWWRNRRSRQGAALIEFAFVLALMLTFVFGIVDFCRALGLKHRAAALSREAANLASRGTELSETVSTIIDAAKPVDLSDGGAVIVSMLEKEGSEFVITQQEAFGSGSSRLGGVGGKPPIPDAGAYPVASILFAGEVVIDFDPITPFERLVELVLPEEVYESAVFYGSGRPEGREPPPGGGGGSRPPPPPGPAPPPGLPPPD